MLLTATTIIILALSGLSYLFGKPVSKEEKETEKREQETGDAEGVSKQQGEIVGTETPKVKLAKEEDKAVPSPNTVTKQTETPPDGEQLLVVPAGDIKQEKSPLVSADASKLLTIDETGQPASDGSRKPSAFTQNLKQDSTQEQEKPRVSVQGQKRDSSPRRSKAKKQSSVRVECGGEKSATRCPSSSPLSGRCFSYGYTFANQSPCDAFCPRLY
ncbi:hypothetical protein ElyMa_000889300 [Elysia marginata]|uniref:BPTI/Kunitz inhibitor domain-containing protein n=1 Tax=Elysia marginata TaxID=1093978 RepID=A0AAV4H981_9GAST|nr:hypothetical protein ElyMa_000889300 [Elysia marginata]